MIQDLFGEGKDFKLNIRKIQSQLVKKALECHIASINGRISSCMRCPVECTNPPGFQPAPAFGKSGRLASIPVLAPFAKIPFYPSVSERFGFANRPDAKRVVDKRKQALQVIEDRIQVTEREIQGARTANQAEREELRGQRESLQREHDEMRLGLEGVYAAANQLGDTETMLKRMTGELDEARQELGEAAIDKELQEALQGTNKELEDRLNNVNSTLEKTKTALQAQKQGAADWEQQFKNVSTTLKERGRQLENAEQSAQVNEDYRDKVLGLQSEINIVTAAMEFPESGEFKGQDFLDLVNTMQHTTNELTVQRDAAVADKESAAKALKDAQDQALTDAGTVRAERQQTQNKIAELQRNVESGVGDKTALTAEINQLKANLDTVTKQLQTEEQQQQTLVRLQQQVEAVAAANLTAGQLTLGPDSRPTQVPKRTPEPIGRQGEPSYAGTPEDALIARQQDLVSSAERTQGTVVGAPEKFEDSSSAQPPTPERTQLFSDPPSATSSVRRTGYRSPTRVPPSPAPTLALPSPGAADAQIAAREKRAAAQRAEVQRTPKAAEKPEEEVEEEEEDPALDKKARGLARVSEETWKARTEANRELWRERVRAGQKPKPKAAKKPKPKEPESEEEESEEEESEEEESEEKPEGGFVLTLAKILAKRAHESTKAERKEWVKSSVGFWARAQ